MQGPGADGVGVVGQLDPGGGVRDPVVDGQFVLISRPFRLAMPERDSGIMSQRAKLERRRYQAGLRLAQIFLTEQGVVAAVSRRSVIKAAGIPDPVGGPGDELLRQDVGIIGRRAARPGSVKILGVGDGHRRRRGGRLSPEDKGKEKG